MTIKRIYFLLTAFFFFNAFFLIPKVPFNLRDVGLLLTFLGFFLFFVQRRNKVRPNPISILLFFYLLFIMIHVGLSSIHYQQSILDGIIAARNQYAYFAFFIIVYYIFTTENDIEIIMNALTIFALLCSIIAILNYIGITLIQHDRYEELSDVRSGIQRVFIPGLNLIQFCLVWSMSKWNCASRKKWLYGMITLFFWGMLFFHQSRGQIFGMIAATFVIFVICRRYKLMVVFLVCIVFSVLILEMTMKENIITNVFSSSITDIKEGSGTVKGRLNQFKTDFDEFKKHPILGSGLVTVRVSKFEKTNMVKYMEMQAKVRKADLGYSHWIKMYGMAGVLWMGLLYLFVVKYCWNILKTKIKQPDYLIVFCWGYFSFIAVSSITLNHFLIPDKIFLFTILLAIIVFLENQRKNQIRNI